MPEYVAIGIAVLAFPLLAAIPYHIRSKRNISLARQVTEDLVPLLAEGRTDLALSCLDEAGGHFSLLARRLIDQWQADPLRQIETRLDAPYWDVGCAAAGYHLFGLIDIGLGVLLLVFEPPSAAALLVIGFIAIYIANSLHQRQNQVRSEFERSLAEILGAMRRRSASSTG